MSEPIRQPQHPPGRCPCGTTVTFVDSDCQCVCHGERSLDQLLGPAVGIPTPAVPLPERASLGAAFDAVEEASEANWKGFADEIDDLLEDKRYEWAAETLSGIRETVEKLGRVTDRQRDAVDNIRDARRE